MTTATKGFTGPLAPQFSEFAKLMRSTGAHHVTLLRVVDRFDRFLKSSYPEVATITKPVLQAWFATFEHLAPTAQKRYRCATFNLCKFLRRHDPATATREDVHAPRWKSTFRPHIFTIDEVARLFVAARMLRALPSDPLRPRTMELVITLLYTCGLRIGEVARLKMADYDIGRASLIIRETKFAKSRLVPLSTSAQRVVDAYVEHKLKLGIGYGSTEPLRSCPGSRPSSLGSLRVVVARLMQQCGIKSIRGRGPRVHDLRHTFAVHRVLKWYREGRDVQALLPQLATYMGHRGLESTQRYLSLSPDVLQEAASLFEQFTLANQYVETKL